MDRKQNNYINVVKGVAAFLMLWGHCIQACIPQGIDFFQDPVFKVIYSFHMPLFMLVSGYLFYFSFQKRSFEELLSTRCKSLLQTIVVCGIFIYFLTVGLINSLKGNFYALLEGEWLPQLTILWFVWSVLGASVVVAFVCKKIKNRFLQAVGLVLGFVFVLMLPCGTSNGFVYPYFLIGFFFCKHKDKLPRWIPWLKYLSLPLFPLLLCFFKTEHYIYTSGLYGRGYTPLQHFDINLFRWTIGLVGSVFALTVLEFLYCQLSKKKQDLFLWRWISHLGVKSLQIYALSLISLSSWLTELYPKLVATFPSIDLFFGRYPYAFDLGFMGLMSIAYAVVLCLLIKLLEALKLNRLLFGR